MKSKQKNKIKDACVRMWDVSTTKNEYALSFFTLTYPGKDSSNATKDIGKFMDSLKKQSLAVAKKYRPALVDCMHTDFSYLYVRELTKKGTDHFHVVAMLPLFPIPEKKRKLKSISYSIPWYYPGERKSKFYSLNKSWCNVRGFYSRNAVRISEDRNGNKLFRVESLDDVMRYVTKYITKADDQLTTRPVYRMSNNLVPWTEPLKFDNALGFAFDQYYGGRVWVPTGKVLDNGKKEFKLEKKNELEHCTLAQVQPLKAGDLYRSELIKMFQQTENDLLVYLKELKEVKQKEKASRRLKKLQKIERKLAEKQIKLY